MLRFTHAIDVINDRIGKVLTYLSLVLCVILIATMVTRYLLRSPLAQFQDFILFVGGSYFVLVGGYCLLVHAHVNMDLFRSRLSLRAGAILDSVTYLFFFAFIIIAFWQGIDLVVTAVKLGQKQMSSWYPPLWPVRLALPIGVFLLLMQGVAEFIRSLHIAVTGRKLE